MRTKEKIISKKIKSRIMVAALLSFLYSVQSYAWFDPTGPMRLMYLTKILLENYKRYKQIRQMISQAKDQKSYLLALNSGIENSIGIMESLPIKDNGILSNLKDFNKSLETVSDIYGKIPKSKEALMQRIHDETVAESLRTVSYTHLTLPTIYSV